jgi:hypothetical protein
VSLVKDNTGNPGTLCLEMKADNTVFTSRCVSGATTQQWNVTAAGTFVNVASGRCVDISNNNDGPLISSPCNGAAKQIWSAPPGWDCQVPTPPCPPTEKGLIKNPYSGKCLTGGLVVSVC